MGREGPGKMQLANQTGCLPDLPSEERRPAAASQLSLTLEQHVAVRGLAAAHERLWQRVTRLQGREPSAVLLHAAGIKDTQATSHPSTTSWIHVPLQQLIKMLPGATHLLIHLDERQRHAEQHHGGALEKQQVPHAQGAVQRQGVEEAAQEPARGENERAGGMGRVVLGKCEGGNRCTSGPLSMLQRKVADILGCHGKWNSKPSACSPPTTRGKHTSAW